jgi:predicted nucleic-acid-binding protein
MAVVFEAIDTNVALRLFLKDDLVQHKAAKKLIEKSQVVFFVPDVVCFEIVYILTKQYGFSRLHVKEFFDSLFSTPKVKGNLNIILPAVKKYAKYPKLSFADCYLTEFTKAQQYEPLWTFDKKLAKQSAAAKLVS